MNKKWYTVVEQTNEELQAVYGIAIFEEDQNAIVSELDRIDNVTCNKIALEQLVCRCNSLNLSPIHLDEVIEDFLLDA